MLPVDMSQRVHRLLPDLEAWLDTASYTVRVVAADAPRGKSTIRILLAEEIAQATCRDILVEWREGEPRLMPAADGYPARIAFGDADRNMAFALIAEMLRPERMPAVGDEGSATLMRLAARIAASDATVLIQGETGTGKEGIARFLHDNSPRADRDFIAVNCAALPETMMEAMLFGHRKGSFTGASASSDGLFLAANGGTLFLDEIAELPLALQAKLLRALQEGEIEPLGSNKLVPFDARVIAATSRDLPELVRRGQFREDLYYRLNVLPLRVPPLRERRSDSPALVEALGEDMALRSGEAPPELTPDALALLAGQHWRGNIRELRNVLEQVTMRSDSQRIDAVQLERILREAGLDQIAPPDAMQLSGDEEGALLRPLAQQIAELEHKAIAAALASTGGNKLATSRLLGISRATLYERMTNPDR
jgi:DNA-binding NtrC family response regulator